MQIENILATGRSKAKVQEVLDYIGANESRLKELMTLVFGMDKTLAINSSWVLYHAIDNPLLDFSTYVERSIEPMMHPRHPMIERGLLKLLWHADTWPEDRFSEVVDHMMETIISTNSMIAAQALSMEALWKHLQPYPELIDELLIVLEEGMPYGSAGYKAKARKMLKARRTAK